MTTAHINGCPISYLTPASPVTFRDVHIDDIADSIRDVIQFLAYLNIGPEVSNMIARWHDQADINVLRNDRDKPNFVNNIKISGIFDILSKVEPILLYHAKANTEGHGEKIYSNIHAWGGFSEGTSKFLENDALGAEIARYLEERPALSAARTNRKLCMPQWSQTFHICEIGDEEPRDVDPYKLPPLQAAEHLADEEAVLAFARTELGTAIGQMECEEPKILDVLRYGNRKAIAVTCAWTVAERLNQALAPRGWAVQTPDDHDFKTQPAPATEAPAATAPAMELTPAP